MKKQKKRSKSHRQGQSFDVNPTTGTPANIVPNAGYGSFNNANLPSNVSNISRPRSNSREFSAMNELSSVMGASNRSLRGRNNLNLPPINIIGGGGPGGRPNFHRRTMSDSVAARGHGGSFGGGGFVGGGMPPPMPNQPMPLPPGFDQQFLQRHGSFSSHHSVHSSGMNKGVYLGGGDVNNETEAFLHQTMGGSIHGGGPTGATKSRSHMRQKSVNLFMKNFRGEVQPTSCKGVVFALLFMVQLVVMCFVGLRYGPDALVATAEDLGPNEGLDDDEALEPLIDGDSSETVTLAYWNIIKMAYTCGAFAIIVSACALAFMMAMSRRLVYVALVLSIGVSFAWGTIGIGISPKSFVPITGIIALMLTVGYMFVVWDRIPFASANLTTALSGVGDNLGLVGVAFFFQFLALVCSIYYSFTFVGLHDAISNGDLMDLGDNGKIAVDVLLLVSYYWTYQVLRHIVIVTVAGTIGSWWFKKPSALYSTFLQATVFNFGSICYGSLFVGFVQLLRQFTEGLRPNRDDSAMMCLYECCVFFQERLVSCVDDLADSFTPWAYTYIGLYHYGLKDAGHKANELFDRRGWSRIVTDDLVPTVLSMVSLVIGGLSGSFAVILQALDGHGLTSFGHPVLVSFTIGFVVGIVLSTILFSIISSSVAAVIVCFAGSPVEFHQNYPELSHEMRLAWREVWPGSLDIGGGF